MQFELLPDWFKDENQITDEDSMILAYYRQHAITTPEDLVVTLGETKDSVTRVFIASTVQCRDAQSLLFVIQSVMRHYNMEGAVVFGVLIDGSLVLGQDGKPLTPGDVEFVLLITKDLARFGSAMAVLSNLDIYNVSKLVQAAESEQEKSSEAAPAPEPESK